MSVLLFGEFAVLSLTPGMRRRSVKASGAQVSYALATRAADGGHAFAREGARDVPPSSNWIKWACR